MTFEIDISDRQSATSIDIAELNRAIEHALRTEQIASAVLSVSIVDNDAIHRINREHLQHDYPTDVISFQLDFSLDEDTADPDDPDGILRASGAMIEGEIIASAQMASEMASTGQWTAMNELTLYVIHGLLHICGYDDLKKRRSCGVANVQSCIRSRLRRSIRMMNDIHHRYLPTSIPRYSFADAHVTARAELLGIMHSTICPIVSLSTLAALRKSAGIGVGCRPLRSASRIARGRCQADVRSPIRCFEF
jgi:probable rRNA maturation factor